MTLKKIKITDNVQRHKAFETGIGLYMRYLSGVDEGKNKYDGESFKQIIDSFMPVLESLPGGRDQYSARSRGV